MSTNTAEPKPYSVTHLKPRDFSRATVCWGDIPLKNGELLQAKPTMVLDGKIYHHIRDTEVLYIGNSPDCFSEAYYKGYSVGRNTRDAWVRSEARTHLDRKYAEMQKRMEDEIAAKMAEYTETIPKTDPYRNNTIGAAAEYDRFLEMTDATNQSLDLDITEEEQSLLNAILKNRGN